MTNSSAARRYQSPACQMLAGLSSQRAQGATFTEAWDATWATIHLPHETTSKHMERNALEETKPEWEAAYHGIETPTSRLLASLLEQMRAEVFGDEELQAGGIRGQIAA
ncbi:MAG: hypothetical protein WKF94_12970 [Solirubrobacteraceae bacterium]